MDIENRKEIIGELISKGVESYDDIDIRNEHGTDQSPFSKIVAPDIVTYPKDKHDVCSIINIAQKWKVPVIPYGAGTSVEGHVLAILGGISIDMTRMNKILEISPNALRAVVQPGVTRKQIDNALKEYGMCFPAGPGVNATLGGMCSTGASGTNAVRYGTMKDNVLGLEVISANGDVVKMGSKAKKSSAGYDLTRLMIGSEGTLGIITEITISIQPIPEQISAAICSFDSIGSAVNSVIKIIQTNIPIAKVELIDAHTMSLVNNFSNLDLSETPKLIMEFHGSNISIQDQVHQISSIIDEYNGSEFLWTTEEKERAKLWQARHDTYYAAMASREGCRCVSTDTCVPIDNLSECLLDSVEEVNKTSIPYFLVGHVGDGNFHFGYLIDPDSEEEKNTVDVLNHNLVKRAISMGGTCTGEHGIGIHKMPFLNEEFGEEAVTMMKVIKKALDPNNILNPGKVVSIV